MCIPAAILASRPPLRAGRGSRHRDTVSGLRLYRRVHAHDAASPPLAQWRFFGPGRVADFQFGNGVRGTHMNDAGTNAAVQQGVPLPPWGGPCSDRLGYDGAVQRDS